MTDKTDKEKILEFKKFVNGFRCEYILKSIDTDSIFEIRKMLRSINKDIDEIQLILKFEGNSRYGNKDLLKK